MAWKNRDQLFLPDSYRLTICCFNLADRAISAIRFYGQHDIPPEQIHHGSDWHCNPQCPQWPRNDYLETDFLDPNRDDAVWQKVVKAYGERLYQLAVLNDWRYCAASQQAERYNFRRTA